MCSVFPVVKKKERRVPDQLRRLELIEARSVGSELPLGYGDVDELKPRPALDDASQKTLQLAGEASGGPAVAVPTASEKPIVKRTSVGGSFVGNVFLTYAPPCS